MKEPTYALHASSGSREAVRREAAVWLGNTFTRPWFLLAHLLRYQTRMKEQRRARATDRKEEESVIEMHNVVDTVIQTRSVKVKQQLYTCDLYHTL